MQRWQTRRLPQCHHRHFPNEICYLFFLFQRPHQSSSFFRDLINGNPIVSIYYYQNQTSLDAENGIRARRLKPQIKTPATRTHHHILILLQTRPANQSRCHHLRRLNPTKHRRAREEIRRLRPPRRVRHNGPGELPWTEKILLGLALVTLLPLRVALSLNILLVYYLICRICTIFLAPNREDDQEDYAHMGGWRRTVIVLSGRFLARVMLFIIGFYWIRETYRINPERSVGKLPLVGLISKCLGCVYVQRESKSSEFKGVSGIVNKRVLEAYQNKYAPIMMLFPEGTTTNGDFLLPFKTGAFLPKVPVLPMILRYPYERFSPAWDTISGVRHVILLFCQFINHLEVTRLPIYYPSQQEKDDPKLYAHNVWRLMAREGNLIMSDIGLAEK